MYTKRTCMYCEHIHVHVLNIHTCTVANHTFCMGACVECGNKTIYAVHVNGVVQGFKHFATHMRGREEMVCSIVNEPSVGGAIYNTYVHL